ncbi:predicted protein [Phaeodactylum tricornutum CCAP 1055/1]|jgi:hypothetical protein|uniref:Uncharacterized protein n=1 Tax=Phaeodactylum tricornutum (strain CCAP 1055/1) TaxID=556484 RepID=B7G2W9_PHATC|nr:predicted protein [Phaeodactylum tricornutum CCAP 1055/1]EEC47200.1 predicted protein [Phaeodactylum tricornutum CCAP 1055/1]|eukprot:XP_002181277.1 predicted protein [Phaeodactylum tricornutum CCAP 1055/1]
MPPSGWKAIGADRDLRSQKQPTFWVPELIRIVTMSLLKYLFFAELVSSIGGFYLPSCSSRGGGTPLWVKRPDFPQPLSLDRRRALEGLLAGVATGAFFPFSCYALDFDAFMSKELESSSASKTQSLSSDAALCKYGQPSAQTGEACVRAGLPTTRAKGGVDAFGNINRGDFVRCKKVYENKNDSWVESWNCE